MPHPTTQHFARDRDVTAPVQTRTACLLIRFAPACSGGSGGGTKGPSVVDKRKQQFPCAFCDRIFQQKDRHAAHVKSKHAAEAAEAEAGVAGDDDGPTYAPAAGPSGGGGASSSAGGVMTAASKAGYYTSKSPGLLLLEHMRASKQPKARVKAVVRPPPLSPPSARAALIPALVRRSVFPW